MKNQTKEKQNSSEPTRPGNIYDAFVKNIFGQMFVFSDFLLHYADSDFVDKLDLDKISSSPTHYIAPSGVERILDLVFSCPLKNRTNAKTMIVFEHAGNTFADLPVRLLYYAFSIW
ncbi:MAG: Rpn family recombination-promoting nuclease/putative transposase, partial [Planctomycetaceae bacterium]|nr:Rpn family recombination-promoting nuclease/putative transposase [Planctomycetaceae bacterium]